jgi:signal transduction histidine kinase
VIGAPALVLGLLLVLSAFAGARVRERDRGAVGRFLLSPLHPASWAATAAILVGFWVELLAFTIVISLFSVGASLLVVGVGLVIVAVAIEASRVVAGIERWRVSLADPRPLRAHAYRPYGSGLRDLLFALFLDLPRWRDVLYVFIAFPLAVLEFLFAVTLWTLALWLLALPVWAATTGLPFSTAGLSLSTLGIALIGGLVGLLLLPVAASVSRGLIALHRAVVEGLLCDSQQQLLARRVQTLEGSRKAVIDVEASELRRIERDLHDGAQQRLVMLTIDLGMAAEQIDRDPGAARALVIEAQDQARLALAELRNLVRGIAPAILLDRGLVPALSALAGRSPVSTVVLSTVPAGERLPDAVERGAYFVVAEALANVAKHASATRCEVRCRREPDRLVVEVWDDGTGGAAVAPTGGLAGLAGRVEALDGTLTIDSPAGGPTLVRAQIPVATEGPVVAAATAPWAAPTAATAAAPAPPAIPGWRPPDQDPR